MENQTEPIKPPTPPVPPPSQQPAPVVVKPNPDTKVTDKMFALIGKMVFGLALAGVLIFGGYYLGTHYQQLAGQQTASTTNPASALPTATPATAPIATPPAQPQPTPSAWTTGTSYTGVSPFKSFTTYLLLGWSEKKETVGTGYKVTISSGNYQIVISQAPGGGSACAYPGETPGEMTAVFDQPTKVLGFPDTGREFNRATQPGEPSGNTLTYLFCQKRNTGHGMPTDLGYITYTVPQNPSAEMLGQMDAIIGMLH